MKAAIDTSAILAALFSEAGADAASEALAEGVVSAVNLAEAFAVLQRRGLDERDARLALEAIGERSIGFDNDQAAGTGLLTAATASAGLSLGDRACLNLARRLGIDAVTADRAWLDVAGAAGVTVRLIR